MGREVGGVGVDRVPALDERAILEAEVGVDAAEAGAASGLVGVEQQARAVDGAVVVELDRLLEALQRLHRPVGGLLGDRVVEVRRRVLGVRLLGELVLAAHEVLALLLEVGLAQVAAQERLAGVEAHRDLDLLAALGQLAVPDEGQPEAQPREGIGRVELDRLGEGGLRLARSGPGSGARTRGPTACEPGSAPGRSPCGPPRGPRPGSRATSGSRRAAPRRGRPWARARRPSPGSRGRPPGRTRPAARRRGRSARSTTSGRPRPTGGPARGPCRSRSSPRPRSTAARGRRSRSRPASGPGRGPCRPPRRCPRPAGATPGR